MHMLCKKKVSSAEMETLRRSRIPTTVVMASGEVQTNEEAYVHDLDLFVTVQLLDDTPEVLSLRIFFHTTLKTLCRMMLKIEMIFSSISGNFVHRPHVEPRVKPYVPREASFPIPL